MIKHNHEHDDNCTCGCHDHDHDHHEHHHEHHDHHHDHDDGCDCEECRTKRVGEGYTVEHHIHDEACVISGNCDVTGEYETIKIKLREQLEAMALAIQQRGGIVGHIKASAEIETVDMFSVTDLEVMVKRAPDQQIHITVAAIVFGVEPEPTKDIVENIFKIIRA